MKKFLSCLAAMVIAFTLIPGTSFADESANGAIYYLGSSVNTGLNNGYSESNEITEKDPHFGWKLGQFSVSGYTSVKVVDGISVFLKTAGDKIKLSFELAQNISSLNGNEALTISEDSDGYDQHFGVNKTNFEHGTLIVRQTDYQNATHEPQLYTNFLSGKEQGADTEVQLFEEGDYEVCLDYEIKADTRKLDPVSIFPDYSDYKLPVALVVAIAAALICAFIVVRKRHPKPSTDNTKALESANAADKQLESNEVIFELPESNEEGEK